MILLRHLVGDVLRRHRQNQRRTLREVASAARISLGYLSEVERGQKEPSSELLSAICDALRVPLSGVLQDVAEQLAQFERAGGFLPPVEVERSEPRREPVGVSGRSAPPEPVSAGAGAAPGYVPVERVSARLIRAGAAYPADTVGAPQALIGGVGLAPITLHKDGGGLATMVATRGSRFES